MRLRCRRLSKARQEASKPLRAQVKCGQFFAVMKRLRHKPALAKAQFQAAFRHFIDRAHFVAEAQIIAAQLRSSILNEINIATGAGLGLRPAETPAAILSRKTCRPILAATSPKSIPVTKQL